MSTGLVKSSGNLNDNAGDLFAAAKALRKRQAEEPDYLTSLATIFAPETVQDIPQPKAPEQPTPRSPQTPREIAQVGYLHNIWKYEKVNAILFGLGLALAIAGAIAAPYITVGVFTAFMASGFVFSAVGGTQIDFEHITPEDLSKYSPHEHPSIFRGILRTGPCSCEEKRREANKTETVLKTKITE